MLLSAGSLPIEGALGSRGFTTAASVRDLSGATVEAGGSVQWHAAGGMEYAFKKGWAA